VDYNSRINLFWGYRREDGAFLKFFFGGLPGVFWGGTRVFLVFPELKGF